MGGRHAQGGDNGIQCVIDALHDFGEIALKAAGIAAHGEFPLHGCRREAVCFRNQAGDGVNALIQVILDNVEITQILIGNLLRNVSVGDPSHITCCQIERRDKGVHHQIDAGNKFSPTAKIRLGVVADCCVASLHSRNQIVRLLRHRLQRMNHTV